MCFSVMCPDRKNVISEVFPNCEFQSVIISSVVKIFCNNMSYHYMSMTCKALELHQQFEKKINKKKNIKYKIIAFQTKP